jgi:hypothetical protein
MYTQGDRGPNQYGPAPKGVPDNGTAYGYPTPGMPY